MMSPQALFKLTYVIIDECSARTQGDDLRRTGRKLAEELSRISENFITDGYTSGNVDQFHNF